jgi:hypothetical protein
MDGLMEWIRAGLLQPCCNVQGEVVEASGIQRWFYHFLFMGGYLFFTLWALVFGAYRWWVRRRGSPSEIPTGPAPGRG